MSLQIGSVNVPENVILAPMSGVTDLPFRQQVRQFGGHLVVSEMIASDAMTRIQRHQKKCAKCTAIVQPKARFPFSLPELNPMRWRLPQR